LIHFYKRTEQVPYKAPAPPRFETIELALGWLPLQH